MKPGNTRLKTVVLCPTLLHWSFVVHLWTLTGLVFAALALKAIFENEMDAAARFLLSIILVDFTDGILARRLRVRERMPLISGEIIDYIHDLVGMTFVPMFFFYRENMFLPQLAFPLVVAATCVATLKYSMKPYMLSLGYSIGAPPIFASLFLFYFLDLGQIVNTTYAILLILWMLLPIRFPITSLVTTHWQPGWQSITNYLVFLSAAPILVYLHDAPRFLFWILLVNIILQLTMFPLLLHSGIIKPGFQRRY